MVQIYTDKETQEIMNRLKEKDLDINFSKIFKEALKREINNDFVEESRLLKLGYMLDDAKFKEEQSRDRKEKILEQIRIEQERNKKELKDMQDKKIIQKTKEEEKFESIYNNILEFYPGIKETALINDLAEEWVRVFPTTTFDSLFDFMESKGYEKQP